MQPGSTPRLSSQGAFVVQFRDDVNFATGHCPGRVEHVRSGQARHFQALHELLDFFAQMLAAVEAESSDEYA